MTDPQQTRLRILHDPATQRFVIHLQEGDAELRYERPRTDVMDFHHVEVDETMRRRGIGSALVGAGVQWAREHKQQVIPGCPFALWWMKQHPEARDVLVPE